MQASQLTQLPYKRALASLIGVCIGLIAGTISLVAFVLSARRLHIHVGMSRSLFVLLLLAASVGLDGAIGWWQHDRVIGTATRYVKWRVARLERLARRWDSRSGTGGGAES